MKPIAVGLLVIIVAGIFVLTIAHGKLISAGSFASLLHSQLASPETFTHVETSFDFSVPKPYETVVPLFGALGERCWGGEDWNPQFSYPQPPQDISGAVFSIKHGHSSSTWINTSFDLKSGHIQYVYFVRDALAAVVDIQARSIGSSGTSVTVTYQRTALNPQMNSHVRELSKQDHDAGQHWAAAIRDCLSKK